jgi:hypothetical protein
MNGNPSPCLPHGFFFANQSGKVSLPIAVWPLTWLIVIGFNRPVSQQPVTLAILQDDRMCGIGDGVCPL